MLFDIEYRIASSIRHLRRAVITTLLAVTIVTLIVCVNKYYQNDSVDAVIVREWYTDMSTSMYNTEPVENTLSYILHDSYIKMSSTAETGATKTLEEAMEVYANISSHFVYAPNVNLKNELQYVTLYTIYNSMESGSIDKQQMAFIVSGLEQQLSNNGLRNFYVRLVTRIHGAILLLYKLCAVLFIVTLLALLRLTYYLNKFHRLYERSVVQ